MMRTIKASFPGHLIGLVHRSWLVLRTKDAAGRTNVEANRARLNRATAEPLSPNVPYTRRLSDKILMAFHQACDQRDLEVATWLVYVLEGLFNQQTTEATGNRRRDNDCLVAAYERLWNLRHPVRNDSAIDSTR